VNKLELQLNKIHCGDNVEVMKTFPSNSIDLAVTSPPYWGLRDYGTGDNQLGMEPHPQMFVDHLVEIFREVKRVLKPSGSFWLNLGDTYYGSNSGKGAGPEGKNYISSKSMPEKNVKNTYRTNWLQPKQKLMMPHRVAIALQDDGWILRNDVIWHKPNHMPESVRDRLTKSYENFFFFVKSRKYYFDLDEIREPYAESSIQRLTQPGIMSQMGGDKQEELYGGASGNGNRPADILKGLASKYAMREDSDALGSPRARAGKRKKISIKDICPGCGESISKHRINDNNKTMNNQSRMRPPFSYTIEGIRIKLCNPKGKNPGDVWDIPTAPFPGSHFAVFPPKLIEPIIKASCPPDGVVLDPFAGSGTALRVARKLGRSFIGIEVNPEYAAMCESRVRGDKYTPPPEGVPMLSSFSKSLRIDQNE